MRGTLVTARDGGWDAARALAGWEQAYHGANAARLRAAVKRRHDPRERFGFAQG